MIQDSKKSKSRYTTISNHPELGVTEIRISDHWYVKGDSTGRGSAANYTERDLSGVDYIKLSNDRWVDVDGNIFFLTRQPSKKEIEKIIASSEYMQALEELLQA